MISVCVPTVERALRTPFFCSSAIAGGTGSIASTSGRSSLSRNCRAYVESDSAYRRCPSAYNVSKASEDLPDPETPVMTVRLPIGIVTDTSFRL